MPEICAPAHPFSSVDNGHNQTDPLPKAVHYSGFGEHSAMVNPHTKKPRATPGAFDFAIEREDQYFPMIGPPKR
jgi:hypothetical protein